jgi:hypothetical protein
LNLEIAEAKKEEYQRVRERADTQKTKAAETGKKDKKKRDIEPAAAALRPEHPAYSRARALYGGIRTTE